MEGILLVDKPQGWTSFDVVNYVRKIVANIEGKKPRNVKVGHTGTLDPMATGLLVLCVGRQYTKRMPILMKHDKTYEAAITFGASSDTGDAEGVITKDKNAREITMDDVLRSIPSFIGEIEQTPPQYSAVKVDGKRAYELARQGKHAEIKSRKIRVHDIYIESFVWPILMLRCHVGSGTYVRVLAEDIAAAVGQRAYLSGLRRTVVDTWTIDTAVEVETLDENVLRDNLLAL